MVDSEGLGSYENRVIGVVVGAALVALPIVISSAGYDAFRFPKALVLRLSALLLLAVYALGAVWRGSLPSRFPPSRFVVLWLFVLGWTVLSAALSERPSASLWAVTDLFAGTVLFWSAANFSRSVGSARMLLLIYLPALVLVTVITLQLLDIWHPLIGFGPLSRHYEDAYILKRAALLGNRNDVGIYLLLPLAVSLGQLRDRRLWATIPAVLVLYGIVATTTATAIATAALMIVLEVTVSARRSSRASLAIAALLLLLIIGALAIGGSNELKQRIGLQSGDVFFAEAARGRAASFAVASFLIWERPLFGVGPGQFPVEFTEPAVELDLSGWFAGSTYFDMVHNDYLEIAAEAGLPALVAALLILVSVARTYVSRRQNNMEGTAHTGLLALLAMGMVAFIQFPLQVAAVYGTWAIVAGITYGYVQSHED